MFCPLHIWSSNRRGCHYNAQSPQDINPNKEINDTALSIYLNWAFNYGQVTTIIKPMLTNYDSAIVAH